MNLPARSKPFILGLTGSIGMGKSTVAAMFQDLGVPLFDADAEVRRLQAAGGALLLAIEEAFPGTTGSDGVDRDALGTLVFGDPEKLAVLEGIVHPAVARVRAEFMERHSDAPIVVFDIPLLFERGGFAAVDHIAVVSAPPEVQRERVLARPDMTPEKFEKILKLQVPDEEKRARADTVINTGQSLEATRAEVNSLVAHLSAA